MVVELDNAHAPVTDVASAGIHNGVVMLCPTSDCAVPIEHSCDTSPVRVTKLTVTSGALLSELLVMSEG